MKLYSQCAKPRGTSVQSRAEHESQIMNRKANGSCNQGGRLIKTSRGIMSIAPALGAAAFGVICAGSVSAQDAWPSVPDATMTDLGTLGGTFSSAVAVSADGSVIVGRAQQADDAGGNTHAASWVDGTVTDLGTLGGDTSGAQAVSADGGVIVGRAYNADDEQHAASWVGGEIVDLGTLEGGNRSEATIVSADGNIIVGRARNASRKWHAVLWERAPEGQVQRAATDLGTLGGDSSEAYAVTVIADGGVIIVGRAQTVGDNYHAAFWHSGSPVGATDLGTLGGTSSVASAVSADGSVIVGMAQNAVGDQHAVSWVVSVAEESISFNDLGTLGGDTSSAEAVSADGSVIVGNSENADNNEHAVAWIDGSTTATDLGTLGGLYSTAYAVSADGSVIVGYSENAGRLDLAFIYKTQMQDLSNLMLSFPTMANDTQIAVAELEYSAGRLMGTTCLADAGIACLRVDGTLSNTGATSSDNIEARSSQSVSLTYGRGLNAQTTLGGTLSITPSGADNNGFDMGRTVGLSLWGAYSESGQLGTGWQASASVGRNTGNADISRGRGLDNVMVSTGSADVTTNSMQATLGYGVQQQDWLFTPSATLTRHTTTRDAYSESGGDFNAAYDSLSVSSTTLDLQLAADYHVSDTGTLMLEAGMVKDLNVDAITLTGTSDMPGMTAVSTEGGLERNDTRGFASIGYRHELNDSSSITGALRVGQSIFGNQLQVNVGVGFAIEF